jgi:hypothetical protein
LVIARKPKREVLSHKYLTQKTKVMKTRITILLLLMAIANFGHAQKIKGFAGSLKLGYSGAPGSASTFSEIAPQSVDGFTNNYFAFGAEGYYRTGKFIIGLEGLWGAQGDYSFDDDHAEPFVGAGHARFGYIVNNNDRYWIYPSIGTGSSLSVLSTYNKTTDGETENTRNKVLISPSFDCGINADFIVNNVDPDRTKYGAFILGVRAGYRASFRHDNWLDGDGDKLRNLPSYGNNAFYVTLSIGGGWFMKKV